MTLPLVLSLVCVATAKLVPRHGPAIAATDLGDASAHSAIGVYLRSLTGPDSTLVFATAADTLYSRYALAYAASMRRLGISAFVVLCIDRDVLTRLQAKRRIVGYHALHDSHTPQFHDAGSVTTPTQIPIYLSVRRPRAFPHTTTRWWWRPPASMSMCQLASLSRPAGWRAHAARSSTRRLWSAAGTTSSS